MSRQHDRTPDAVGEFSFQATEAIGDRRHAIRRALNSDEKTASGLEGKFRAEENGLTEPNFASIRIGETIEDNAGFDRCP